jgi:hypothetical protein
LREFSFYYLSGVDPPCLSHEHLTGILLGLNHANSAVFPKGTAKSWPLHDREAEVEIRPLAVTTIRARSSGSINASGSSPHRVTKRSPGSRTLELQPSNTDVIEPPEPSQIAHLRKAGLDDLRVARPPARIEVATFLDLIRISTFSDTNPTDRRSAWWTSDFYQERCSYRGSIMTNHYHALVWIDHHQAKIFHFDASGSDRELIRSSNPHQHLHHKANSTGSGHAALDTLFLSHVADALAHAGAILITGPGSTKTELASYIRRTRAQLAHRISGVETVDHPTDGQLTAFGRTFFEKDDRMNSQIDTRKTSS